MAYVYFDPDRRPRSRRTVDSRELSTNCAASPNPAALCTLALIIIKLKLYGL